MEQHHSWPQIPRKVVGKSEIYGVVKVTALITRHVLDISLNDGQRRKIAGSEGCWPCHVMNTQDPRA